MQLRDGNVTRGGFSHTREYAYLTLREARVFVLDFFFGLGFSTCGLCGVLSIRFRISSRFTSSGDLVMDDNIAFHEERQIFYYELGLMLTQWAHVEHAFQHAYSSSFKHYDLANAEGFNAIENFRSRLLVADVVMQRNLKPEFKGEWDKLHDKLRRRSLIRNAIVHSYVISKPNNRHGKRIVLPNEDDPHNVTKSIGVKNLVVIRYAFFGLSNLLLNFADRISGAARPFSVPHGSLDRPPSLRVLLDQMRGVPEPPHRPLRG
jgi:hypothetical protein